MSNNKGKRRKNHQDGYLLDLCKTSNSGDFLCPQCGTAISPDDTTEEVYSIVEAKIKDSNLDEVVICCNICASEIRIVGFSSAGGPSEAKEENLNN